MRKYLFAGLIFVHAFYHSLGFYRAFGFAYTETGRLVVTEHMGLLWLIPTVLFMITAVAYLAEKGWAFITIPAVAISQVLIISTWSENKWATIVNILIVLIVMPVIGQIWFKQETKQEINHLVAHPVQNAPLITPEMIVHLPPAVQRWLKRSGVIGRVKFRFVQLEQSGILRTKPKGRWMPFIASQFFTTEHPGFVWAAKIDFLPNLCLCARDMLIEGEADMVIKMAGFFPIANELPGEKLNASSMVRFLAEICWFPTAALSKFITWQSIDQQTASAIFKYDDIEVAGIFKFNEHGDLMRFEGNRYKETSNDATLLKWTVQMKRFGNFEGIRVPVDCSVTWKLQQGDFTWADIQVHGIKYDSNFLRHSELYNNANRPFF